ncbi:unnamed protein product [Oppiella nova]|uniref:Fibronectin type-III domain-containing protein n=1 Tax=Oppiella nova TaxID=334625 RepID=A0A7R9QK39_9ACAR|nr:unnamed protein product [Oppiella nova]CAG2166887.1 unnamed protein product [Oppiella nova]
MNVSRNSVVIAWDPGFDFGYEQSFRIRYRKVGPKPANVEPAQFKYIIVNNTSNAVLITNLDADTEYQLSISSRNRLGESLMSREFLNVKTLANVSKRKSETVLASADEQRLGYNNQLISEDIIELSVIVSALVIKRKTRQIIQKKSDSKDMSSANSAAEDPLFTISASTTLESSCRLDTTFLHQPSNDKCLYSENRVNEIHDILFSVQIYTFSFSTVQRYYS